MAPITPDPKKIKSFRKASAFESWLAANHSRETELWLKIHKKDSGLSTVTYAQALDVALCWGWIDGIRKAYDENSFLQRFTPRKPRSIWSQTNREHVARLTAAGRMTAHGQRHIDARMAAELASYTERHMADEEAIMEATAYPGLEDHRGEHHLARTILLGFRNDHLDGRLVEAATVLQFLERWLGSHIAIVDLAMARHALAAGWKA